MEGEATFKGSGEFTTHLEVVYVIFIFSWESTSATESGTGRLVSRGAISEERETMMTMLFRFTFRCQDQEREVTELELRAVSLFPCAAGKDEFKRGYRCGQHKKTFQ